MSYPPRRAALLCAQRQTISSSVLQLQLVQKTIVNDVEC
jgi:hypothetical protein